MSSYLALLVGFAAGALTGGAAVWTWMARRPAAPAPAAAPEPVRAAPLRPDIPGTGDEEVRQVMAASQATLAELEGRYRGRRAAGPEEGEQPRPRRRPKRSQ